MAPRKENELLVTATECRERRRGHAFVPALTFHAAHPPTSVAQILRRAFILPPAAAKGRVATSMTRKQQ